ncbi:hypothetical protein M406DRAFT_355164 [Cryphonectria parasitica EP155]|uniref:Uncharacterized protein n=1 Tax=Cryphonectria parasitica (strain ATCC 38755 / EP155) TaxID=660469 RepID=A0A9P4Y8V6_CRYP1|nr:uncharacterized protein M406DRAFT_355164 [Cryphonectria parasitica EP155]KAF3769102.1 hypothetical protein M406DRAFT_355164 [Cryphonectria parasitica EP155]
MYRGLSCLCTCASPNHLETLPYSTYSLASTKTSFDSAVSDRVMLGMFFFRSLWKSMSGPSEGLPVLFNNPEISPVLSILGSLEEGTAVGLGGSAGLWLAAGCPWGN